MFPSGKRDDPAGDWTSNVGVWVRIGNYGAIGQEVWGLGPYLLCGIALYHIAETFNKATGAYTHMELIPHVPHNK